MEKMKNPLLTVLFVLVFVQTACFPAAPDIGGGWNLVSYGAAASPTPALPDVDTFIQFENGQMSGNFGCNDFGGEYKLNGDQITFSGVMSTLMYCEETSAQEQGALAILSGGAALRIQINGGLLTITSSDGSSVINLSPK